MKSKLPVASLLAVIVILLMSTLVLTDCFLQSNFLAAVTPGILFTQPKKKISFERKLFTGFACVFILMIVLSVFSSYYNNKRSSTAALVKHTNEVLNQAEQILSVSKDFENGSRGYVITGDSAYLDYFIIAKITIPGQVEKLKALTSDNRAQQARIDSLSSFIDKRIDFSNQTIVLRNDKGITAATELVATRRGMLYMDKIRNLIAEIQQEEKQLLVHRELANNRSIVSFNRAFIVLLASVFVLLMIILFAIRNNINSRKKAEADLKDLNTGLEQKVKERTAAFKQSEEQYRLLFQSNPMPMWVINLTDFRFLDVNKMAVLQYGYSREEFLAMTALQIRPDEDKQAFIQSDHSYLTHGHTPNYNKGIWRHRKKDGSIIQVEIIGHEIIFEGAEARLILSHDVTEYKEAEAKIIASEKQFRSTLDNMLEGAQIIGFDWRYVYINDSLAKHAKYNREEMIGYTVMEKFPGIEQTEIFKVYERCFNERVSIHLENEFRFPDDSVGWFELSFQPIPEGIFILSIDITERKRAEAAILAAEANYREIFEKASDAIYLLEIETGQILEINHRATEITGHSKEKLIQRDPELLITDDPLYTRTKSQAYVQKAANGEPQQFDWLIKKADGTYSWIEVNLTKANIAGEERILSFFREINDRKKAELQVQKLNEELEQKVIIRTEQLKKSNEELEAFSYSVSHDLRAPLRGIIGFTNILEEDYSSKLDDEARRITSVIKNNTIKMGNLIDDLLRFSQLGRQQIVKTNLDTNKMITEVITEMGLKDMHSQLRWIIPSLPNMNADPNTIKQVWINLISNAVKYSNKKQYPVIEIGTLPAKNEIIFFVKDNGVGFDEKYKNKLFKVFQRLHSSADFEGTGVGLAIIEKVISRHAGRVWAEATVGEGACFYFSLPVE